MNTTTPQTEPDWHNPANYTQDMLPPNHRFLLKSEFAMSAAHPHYHHWKQQAFINENGKLHVTICIDQTICPLP